MNTLLIDNSNSRTKFALAGKEGLGERRAIATADLDAHSVAATLKDWEFERIVLSSVVPEKGDLIRAAYPDKTLTVNHEIALGVAIDFPEPSTIGADRLPNAAALAALYEVPGVVIDFGTAVTFDIVSAAGAYVGGVIAPGLEAMTDYLHERTALLPRIEISEPGGVVGKSTEEAMLSGAVYGYRGLIRGILSVIRAQAGESLHAVATGGYAELISARLPEIEAVNPDLTLEGLRIIGELNPLT
ncbi:MAG: type III pantothenate kinase [Verrucomicrobiales bacterium]